MEPQHAYSAKVGFIWMILPHVLFAHLKRLGAYFAIRIQYVLSAKVDIILIQARSNASNVRKKAVKFA